jgi:peptide/nickel transport system permease protein
MTETLKTTADADHRGALRKLITSALTFGRARVGLALILLITLLAIVGPWVTPQPPNEFVAPPYGHSARTSVFGADYLGRDVLSRFLSGGLSLLSISLAATIVGVASGAAFGIFAALRRARGGELMMRGLDVILAFPAVVLSLLFVTIIGPKIWLLVLVVALAHFPQCARVLRAASAEVVERDFVRAAEIVGVPRRRILTQEILPNVTGQLVVEFGIRFTFSVAIVAALSFLGLGVQPPRSDWGLMINENKSGLSIAPWAVLLPVIAIGVLTVGVNLLSDAIGRAAARITVADDHA